MNLADWAEGLFDVVEQDGATTKRIKLVTPINGDVWHTWFPGSDGWPDPSDWAAKAESTLRGLEQQFSGRQQITFVAESQAGEVLSQLPWKIVGKLAGGNLESVQQASASTFASLAQTIERIQELSNRQLDNARTHLEMMMAHSQQQAELLTLYRQREIVGPPGEGGEAQVHPLQQMLIDYLPQLLALGQLAIQAQAKKQASEAERARPTVGAPNPPPQAKAASKQQPKRRRKRSAKPEREPKPKANAKLPKAKPSRRTIVAR